MSTHIQEVDIDKIVRQVLSGMNPTPSELPRASKFRGVFPTADEAVAAAQKAQSRFRSVSLSQRKSINSGDAQYHY